MGERIYAAIDLKSFYASVECVDRKLDALKTNLVVADVSRTEKTICLAVSPSLKDYGISGRARLFEVVQAVKEINRKRLANAPQGVFTGSSVDAEELERNPSLSLDYIAAKPRMALYMSKSTEIYEIYLRYIAPEDIHVYSVDEVFLDLTDYLHTYKKTARELVKEMITAVYAKTEITATAGIGTNLYLAKIAMDIEAKHAKADEDGVRIAELNERSYRELLWTHKPLTDFWRVGMGTVKRLAKNGIYTMGDIARCSIGKETDYYNEDLLYELFGINAELLIDHAWGYEPCTIAEIKAYKPETHSISSGQVLSTPYDFEKAKLVVREMTDLLVLDLVDKHLLTDQIVLTVGYDIENLKDPSIMEKYHGEIKADRYGRDVPKSAHGSENIGQMTSSTRLIIDAAMRLFDRIVNPDLLVRRMYVVANHVVPEGSVSAKPEFEQLELFTDYGEIELQREEDEEALKRERRLQEAVLSIKKKYGKNAVLKGMNLTEGATAKERNAQIGGHKA